jgi:hypothetical protein
VPTIASSVMRVPAPAVPLTSTVTVNVLDEPGAIVGFVQLIEPVVVHVHPEGVGIETNVVFAGIASVNVPLAQLLGPLLVTTCV